jgi:signal peptidase I
MNRKPGLAVLLSLIVPGLGHIYLGQLAPGLALVVAHVALGSMVTVVVVAGLSTVSTICAAALPSLTLSVTASVWAYRSAVTQPPSGLQREFQRPSIYVLVGLLAVPNAASWAFAIRERVAEMFVVPSSSMLPSVLPGSRILVNKLVYRSGPVRRGDLVVFVNPNARHARYIKRVVALPGDVVEMQNDELIVNGRRLDYVDSARNNSDQIRIEHGDASPYPILISTPDSSTRSQSSFALQTVPNGHCFVLGDNRHHSDDSRVHGPLPLSDIVGRVQWIF